MAFDADETRAYIDAALDDVEYMIRLNAEYKDKVSSAIGNAMLVSMSRGSTVHPALRGLEMLDQRLFETNNILNIVKTNLERYRGVL